MSDIEKTLTKTFNDHALKIGIAGGLVSTFLSPLLGTLLMAGTGITLYNRYKKGERVWADPPDNPDKKNKPDNQSLYPPS